MGKLAKQRRYQRRKDAKQIEALKTELDHTRSRLAFTTHAMDDAQNRARRREDQMRRMIQVIKDIAGPASYVLPVNQKIQDGCRRIALSQRPRVESLVEGFNSRPYDEAMVEEVMHFLLCGQNEQPWGRTLHFHVINPPGRESFKLGYAITHTAMRQFWDRSWYTQMVCEQFGAQIHQQIFGENP